MAEPPSPRRKAGAYSRLVGLLKVALPALALCLLGAVLFLDNRPSTELGFSFSEADITALRTGLKVTKPQFSGASLSGDLYDFKAEVVEPRDLDLDHADIETLEGRIAFRDGLVVELWSDRAELDIPAQKVVLDTGIRFQSSAGYRAEASRVEIDIGLGTLYAEGPIRGSGPPGQITAGALEITQADPDTRPSLDNKVTMRFTGGVTMTYIAGEQ